jgi:hypothetical protein
MINIELEIFTPEIKQNIYEKYFCYTLLRYFKDYAF